MTEEHDFPKIVGNLCYLYLLLGSIGTIYHAHESYQAGSLSLSLSSCSFYFIPREEAKKCK